jgi:hypothetical protein
VHWDKVTIQRGAKKPTEPTGRPGQKVTRDPTSDPDLTLDFPNNTGKFLMRLCPHEEIPRLITKNVCFLSIR